MGGCVECGWGVECGCVCGWGVECGWVCGVWVGCGVWVAYSTLIVSIYLASDERALRMSLNAPSSSPYPLLPQPNV